MTDSNIICIGMWTVDARANSFRGLFWGCLLSTLLWAAILFGGIKLGDWFF